MNLSQLRSMGIVASLDQDGSLQLEAPKGALTPDLLDQVRQSKPGLVAEIEGGCEECELGELHPSMFTPERKGRPPAGEHHRAWLIHFADRDPLEVWTGPPATHDQILADYPNAVAAEPITETHVQACKSCRHLARPGRADGYCAERADLPHAYGGDHPLHRLPADGGANCPKWASND